MSLLGDEAPIRYEQSMDLPYSQVQMFDLVADIERYPEFLHEYREIRILSRTGNRLDIDQVIGLPFVNVSLRVEATFNRPHLITVRSGQSVLGKLDIRWGFETIDTGSHVQFQMSLLPPSRFAAGLAEYLMTHAASRTLGAFAGRAAQLYAKA